MITNTNTDNFMEKTNTNTACKAICTNASMYSSWARIVCNTITDHSVFSEKGSILSSYQIFNSSLLYNFTKDRRQLSLPDHLHQQPDRMVNNIFRMIFIKFLITQIYLQLELAARLNPMIPDPAYSSTTALPGSTNVWSFRNKDSKPYHSKKR